MQRQDAPFAGVLYAGLMIGRDGSPAVVEFNCRLGDPEAQVVLPIVTGGVTDSLMRVAEGKALSPLEVSRQAAVTTVLASRGYPDSPETGASILLPDRQPQGVTVFHAGTTRDPD